MTNTSNGETTTSEIQNGNIASTSDNTAKSTPLNGNNTTKRKADGTNSSAKSFCSKKAKSVHRDSSSYQMDSIATVGTSPDRENVDAFRSKMDNADTSKDKDLLAGPFVASLVSLPDLPKEKQPLPRLTNIERKELEKYLGFDRNDTWVEDWMGNLCLSAKEIRNPDGKPRERAKNELFFWAEKGKISKKLLNNLIRYVYNLENIPAQAKTILANANLDSVTSVQEAIRRASYDPKVLESDGWTTVKSETSIGASGGPYRIGERVYWQGAEGVVIAYVHDQDIGDLWKALWVEEDLDTFDLEAEELESARKKFDRKLLLKQKQTGSSQAKEPVAHKKSSRSMTLDYQIKGIEHGIVLAASYGRGARPGVFWPARVMHFSEVDRSGSQKRFATKQKVDVVFLAPYWNTDVIAGGKARAESYTDSLQRHGASLFDSGPLFQIESVDVSTESIIEFPFDPKQGLDIDQLSTSFRFSGLPKAAFSRFVQSHRLALALKNYSQKVMLSTVATEIDKTTANLFEAHALAGQTAKFPPEVLHLPFGFILSQLPKIDENLISSREMNEEPALELGSIIDSMKPPASWGHSTKGISTSDQQSHGHKTIPKPFASPSTSLKTLPAFSEGTSPSLNFFLEDLFHLSKIMEDEHDSMSILLTQNLRQLLSKIPTDKEILSTSEISTKRSRLKALVKLWVVVKTHGEDLITSSTLGDSLLCLIEWRQACERIYKFITMAFSSNEFGNGMSWILSDTQCNLHLTSSECFERAVRLPAAMKAAKEVATKGGSRLKILNAVKPKFLVMAEKEVIRRAHSKSYLRRIKRKCRSVQTQGDIVSLTADSDNNGGEDTKGTQGSWRAAIAAVGASVQAVDMIMNGECVNAFCLTRPPGHHAGRELHAMKAVSNGFCLLNSAACAALYATAPLSEGGHGLRRVCVIDIDVHHGNGTQDILCSTYDPRFLYVSLHAGGPDINGVDPSAEAEEFSHHLARSAKKGIFPGTCGDYSPHEGVLNIPLGPRVTPHAVGAALINIVSPAVQNFSPELIIISSGFDAHKNDPLGLGGLNAEDFGTLTEVICKLAHKSCSGRVVSVLEGGYGVPCCRPPKNASNPENIKEETKKETDHLEVENKIDATKAPTVNKPNQKGGTNTDKKEHHILSPSPVTDQSESSIRVVETKPDIPLKPLAILDLGDELPTEIPDDMSYALMKRLDKCHAEGFKECVKEHVKALAKCNIRQ